MPYIVTAIDRADGDGNYKLTLRSEDGEITAIIPPKLEREVTLTIQETQAVRESKLAGAFGGFLVLDLLRSRPAAAMKTPPSEKTLAIETSQLGLWALRMERPVIQTLIADLQGLLRDDPQTRH